MMSCIFPRRTLRGRDVERCIAEDFTETCSPAIRCFRRKTRFGKTIGTAAETLENTKHPVFGHARSGFGGLQGD